MLNSTCTLIDFNNSSRMDWTSTPRAPHHSAKLRRSCSSSDRCTLRDKSPEPGGRTLSDWFPSPPPKWTEYRHRQPSLSLGHRWNIPKLTPSLEQFASVNQIGGSFRHQGPTTTNTLRFFGCVRVLVVVGMALMDASTMAPKPNRQVGSFKCSKWDWECM